MWIPNSSNTYRIRQKYLKLIMFYLLQLFLYLVLYVMGIYDKIKDFLTSYNNIINKMTKLYNADSSSIR